MEKVLVPEIGGEKISLTHLIGKTCIIDGTVKLNVYQDRNSREIRLKLGPGGAYYVVSQIKAVNRDGGYIVDIHTPRGQRVYQDTTILEEIIYNKKK